MTQSFVQIYHNGLVAGFSHFQDGKDRPAVCFRELYMIGRNIKHTEKKLTITLFDHICSKQIPEDFSTIVALNLEFIAISTPPPVTIVEYLTRKRAAVQPGLDEDKNAETVF